MSSRGAAGTPLSDQWYSSRLKVSLSPLRVPGSWVCSTLPALRRRAEWFCFLCHLLNIRTQSHFQEPFWMSLHVCFRSPVGLFVSQCPGAFTCTWPGQLSEDRAEGSLCTWRPGERCAGAAGRARAASVWCMACQMSLSSWKILYRVCRSVYTGCCCCRLHLLQNNLPTPSPPRRHALQVVSSYGFPVSLLLPPLALSSLILGFIFIGNMAEFPVSGLDGASWGPPRGQN